MSNLYQDELQTLQQFHKKSLLGLISQSQILMQQYFLKSIDKIIKHII